MATIRRAIDIVGEDEPIQTVFERLSIPLPVFRAQQQRLRSLEDEVDFLRQEVVSLRRQHEMHGMHESITKDRRISDMEAEKEITQLILREKSAGNTKLSVFFVSTELALSGEQVQRVFDKFVKAGKMSETDE
ncbi:MAG: hypothetical protein HYS81_01930 [Candidatus Aenigmatarchaeota archaeon]|nr:MAG: hypothetical protein HYS81_01930 [Candidatus Aenigmarchaeota archaeon]